MQKKVCIDALYASLLTSIKPAGRCKQDKGCLAQHELTKALYVEHGSTPCFILVSKRQKSSILIFMSRPWMKSCELDLKLSMRIRENIFLIGALQIYWQTQLRNLLK